MTSLSAFACERCGKTVGLFEFDGDSVRFEGPIKTDAAGNLILRPHQCHDELPSQARAPYASDTRPPIRYTPKKGKGREDWQSLWADEEIRG